VVAASTSIIFQYIQKQMHLIKMQPTTIIKTLMCFGMLLPSSGGNETSTSMLWNLTHVECDKYHIGHCSLYIDCKNIYCMNYIKMYHLNGSSHCESYSSLHISQ